MTHPYAARALGARDGAGAVGLPEWTSMRVALHHAPPPPLAPPPPFSAQPLYATLLLLVSVLVFCLLHAALLGCQHMYRSHRLIVAVIAAPPRLSSSAARAAERGDDDPRDDAPRLPYAHPPALYVPAELQA